MKLDEIVDFNDPEYQRRIQAAMKSLQKAYAPLKKPTDEELRVRAERRAAFDAKRASMEKIIAEVAKKYTGDQREEFEREVLSLIPAADMKNVIDLKWAFDFYNPDRIELNRKSWDEYGKLRAKGDPSVTGIGPSGARNWTGD